MRHGRASSVVRTLRDAARTNQLALVLGLTDGLLTALTLAAASLLGSDQRPSLLLGLRVACAALATAAFTMFVADYADRRARLARAAHQLNIGVRGHMASTRLGRIAVWRSLIAMGIACVSSFLGSWLPLLAGAVLPVPPWTVVVVAVGALAALGAALARVLGGHPRRWAVAMAVGGGAITGVGNWLHLA